MELYCSFSFSREQRFLRQASSKSELLYSKAFPSALSPTAKTMDDPAVVESSINAGTEVRGDSWARIILHPAQSKMSRRNNSPRNLCDLEGYTPIL